MKQTVPVKLNICVGILSSIALRSILITRFSTYVRYGPMLPSEESIYYATRNVIGANKKGIT